MEKGKDLGRTCEYLFCARLSKPTDMVPPLMEPAIQLKQGSKDITTNCESGSAVLRENERGDVRECSGKGPFEGGTLNWRSEG